MPVQCGRCLPCKRREASIWQTRQELESLTHGDNLFVTLTYSPEGLNKFNPTNQVQPEKLYSFIQKLRYHIRPAKFKYFAIGEYGETNGRAHYHANLFGLSMLHQTNIAKAWDGGFIKCLPFDQGAARYLTGYLTDAFVNQKIIGNRRQPFRRMSKGLGKAAVPTLAIAIANSGNEESWSKIEQGEWSPMFIRKDGYIRPIGRYLSEQIANYLGIEDAWKRRKQKYQDEILQELWELSEGTDDTDLRQNYINQRAGKIQRIIGRHNALRKAKSL